MGDENNRKYLSKEGLILFVNTIKDWLFTKVDKVPGMGLSSNDYTTSEKEKLSDIDSGAQVNVIESITVNNVAQTVSSDKSVDITVPTAVSDLDNDANYATTDEVAAGLAEKQDALDYGTPTGDDVGKALVPKTIENGVVTSWEFDEAGLVDDVQINGTSVVQDGIANIPIANQSTLGVVKADAGTHGILINEDGFLYTRLAGANTMKEGENLYRPIVPAGQHTSVFYGLSKVAGVDLKNENVTLGEYPDSSKSAIQSMLGVPSVDDIDSLNSALDYGTKTVDIIAYAKKYGDCHLDSNGEIVAGANYTVYEFNYVGTYTKFNAILYSNTLSASYKAMAFVDENDSVISTIGFTTTSGGSVYTDQTIPTGTKKIRLSNRHGGQNSGTAVASYVADTSGRIINIEQKLNHMPSDVLVGDNSVVNNGVAKIPKATNSVLGAVRGRTDRGISIEDGMTYIKAATSAEIKAETSAYLPIVPDRQHISTYYGLSKLAGVDLANEEVTVGTYPETSKSAIKSMLGVEDPIDVQINGTSIVNNGVANIPYATSQVPGVVMVGSGLGVNANNRITVIPASVNEIKASSTATNNPIIPARQDASVFYGLAKAAGDTTQSQSSNAVGQYTDGAKSAIKSMLGFATQSDITSAISQITQIEFAVVQQLPATGTTGTIYLLQHQHGDSDIYDEYIWIASSSSYEKIGNTDIDLTDYLQKSAVVSESDIDDIVAQVYAPTVGEEAVYLNKERLSYFWGEAKDYIDDGLSSKMPNVTFGEEVVLMDTTEFTLTKVGDSAWYAVDLSVDTQPPNHLFDGRNKYTITINDTNYIVNGSENYSYLNNSNAWTGVCIGNRECLGYTPNNNYPFCIHYVSYLDENNQNAVKYRIVVYSQEQSTTITRTIKIVKQAINAEYIPEQYYKEYPNIIKHGSGRHSLVFGYDAFDATGYESMAEGIATSATGNASHASGIGSITSGLASHAEGRFTLASGMGAHSEGFNTTASGSFSHAEGYLTTASGSFSHAEGQITMSSGASSHSEGANTTASQNMAHAEGGHSTASNYYAHAEGGYTTASGNSSHAEGRNTTASGHSAHSEGYYTTASGYMAHAEGYYSIANHAMQHVFGRYNIEDTSTATVSEPGTYIEIVGNGDADDARSNARTLDWSGNEVLAGKLTVGTAPTNSMDVATKGYVDTTIGSATTGLITDVQVNGSSVVNNGVANVPMATANNFGVVRADVYASGYEGGIASLNNKLYVIGASVSYIRNGNDLTRPVAAGNQHCAVFFGLAKAAGDSTQSASDNAVGTYTESAKTAIQTMLGVPSVDSVVTDVQVDGTSVVNNGVVNLPVASASAFGMVKVSGAMGVDILNGFLTMSSATSYYIQDGTHARKAITPQYQHESVFYGLSKAAGVNLRNEEVTVGTYPEASKTAIKSMLGVNVDDVQINGTSITSNGIANIPVATTNSLGVVMPSDSIGIVSGRIGVIPASTVLIKGGSNNNNPITPGRQHYSVFFGLAKAAGADMAEDDNPTVGVYPDTQKTAIKSMLGVADGAMTIGTVTTLSPGTDATASITGDYSAMELNLGIPRGSSGVYIGSTAPTDSDIDVWIDTTPTDNPYVETITGTTVTIVGEPNCRYMCGTVLEITITPPTMGTIEVIFTSGSSPAVMTLPNTVIMPEWWEGIEANYTYDICITDGIYAGVSSWPV